MEVKELSDSSTWIDSRVISSRVDFLIFTPWENVSSQCHMKYEKNMHTHC
jgi:hypothetical protein